MGSDMHRLAERIILTHLLELEIVQNGSVEEMMAANVAAIFMPHGLGHLIGLVVHDVGGFTPEFPKSKEEGLCWLRTTRILKANMVITVEPGIYFNQAWIKSQLEISDKAQFVNTEALKRFENFGGVRIEDDVLVTES